MKKLTSVLIVIQAIFLFAAISVNVLAEEEPQVAEVVTAEAATIEAATETAMVAVNIPEDLGRFNIKDIYGRIIPKDQLEDWIVIYGFGNEKNADTMIDWLMNMTKVHPNNEGILYVCIADTSKYPKVLGPMVKKVLKREYSKQMDALQQEFDKKNIDPGMPLEDRYIMISDRSGAYFKHFGLWGLKGAPHVVMVDGGHNVRGHFMEYSDEMPQLLSTLLEERETERHYAKLQMRAKKKNTVKKYAIYAGILYLGYKLFD